jgi:hypothetical protein
LGERSEHPAARAFHFLKPGRHREPAGDANVLPGDPLFPLDAIACSVPEWARERIVCRFDPETTEPYWAQLFV